MQTKRYEVQAAFYSDGYAAASGQPVLGFVFVAVSEFFLVLIVQGVRTARLARSERA